MERERNAWHGDLAWHSFCVYSQFTLRKPRSPWESEVFLEQTDYTCRYYQWSHTATWMPPPPPTQMRIHSAQRTKHATLRYLVAARSTPLMMLNDLNVLSVKIEIAIAPWISTQSTSFLFCSIEMNEMCNVSKIGADIPGRSGDIGRSFFRFSLYFSITGSAVLQLFH